MVRELAGQEFDRVKLFKEQVEGKDYFLVTAFGEFDSQAEFKQMMIESFPVLEETSDYIIFDLKHPLPVEANPGKSMSTQLWYSDVTSRPFCYWLWSFCWDLVFASLT